MEIGSIIKKYRIDKNIKQEDMANALGVTPQAVSRWETGISYPDIAMVPLIADYLNVTTDILLGCTPKYETAPNNLLNQSQIDSIFDYIPSPSGKQRKILVVDDAAFMRTTLEDILTRAGHTVTLAANGEECLEILKTNSFDLCILDIVMPVMHGMDALEKIRELYPELSVIMLSAQSLEANVRKARELGASGFVAKPFQPSRILEIM